MNHTSKSNEDPGGDQADSMNNMLNPEPIRHKRRSSKSNPNQSINDGAREIPVMIDKNSMQTEEPIPSNLISSDPQDPLDKNYPARLHHQQQRLIVVTSEYRTNQRTRAGGGPLTKADTNDVVTKNQDESSPINNSQRSGPAIAKTSQESPEREGAQDDNIFAQDITQKKDAFASSGADSGWRSERLFAEPPNNYRELKKEGERSEDDSKDGTSAQFMRRQTLRKIQTMKLTKENAQKLRKAPFWSMDDTALKHYGLGKCRRALAMKLQSKVMRVFQISSVFVYLVTQIAAFICHDITYDQRISGYQAMSIDGSGESRDDLFASDADKAKMGIFIAESVTLLFVLIDFILLTIGYGMLSAGRSGTIIRTILLLANIALLAVFYADRAQQNKLFGTKMLLGSAFLLAQILAIQGRIAEKRNDLRQVAPEQQGHKDQNHHDDSHSHQLEVVSVRQKVIRELRMVQDRIGENDMRADVALEYCIKMILSNQLNEQDFEQGSSSFASSYGSESEQHQDESKEQSAGMKNIMKAWYSQFADKPLIGFKHNSSIFSAEQNIQKTITNKLGQAMGVVLIQKYLNLTPEASEVLKKIDDSDFDIFRLRQVTNGHELQTVLPFILARCNLISLNKLDFNYLMNFVRALAIGYKHITYHNQTHAADVCQTFNYFSVKGGMKDLLRLDNLEHMSCLISAALHDFEHPGVNSVFLVNMNDEMATRHNDVSVLENHHLAASFQIMEKEQDCNWAVNMSRQEYKRCRHVIIQTVLTTDMTKHFAELGQLSSRMADEDFKAAETANKELFIKFMFHLADISNPTKPWDLCRLWTDLLFVEFFAQGDLEKLHEFQVSQFFDRKTTNIAKSQIGFIDFIVKPAYTQVVKVFPELQHLIGSLEHNKEQWTSLFDDYEVQMQNGNTQAQLVESYLPALICESTSPVTLNKQRSRINSKDVKQQKRTGVRKATTLENNRMEHKKTTELCNYDSQQTPNLDNSCVKLPPI